MNRELKCTNCNHEIKSELDVIINKVNNEVTSIKCSHCEMEIEDDKLREGIKGITSHSNNITLKRRVVRVVRMQDHENFESELESIIQDYLNKGYTIECMNNSKFDSIYIQNSYFLIIVFVLDEYHDGLYKGNKGHFNGCSII